MNTIRRQRLCVVLFIVSGFGLAIAFALYALKQNINLFYTPEQIHQEPPPLGKNIRLGGIVVPQSIQRHKNLKISFSVTDYKKKIDVIYEGIPPDLFSENTGVVAIGKLIKANLFQANQLLAKHGNEYMPAEIEKEVQKLHEDFSMKKKTVLPSKAYQGID